MKKILLISVVVFGIGLTAHAQLGEPTTNVKDTFHISSVFYNGTALGRADWPDTIIVEDALNVYIAKYIYVKGKLKYGLNFCIISNIIVPGADSAGVQPLCSSDSFSAFSIAVSR